VTVSTDNVPATGIRPIPISSNVEVSIGSSSEQQISKLILTVKAKVKPVIGSTEKPGGENVFAIIPRADVEVEGTTTTTKYVDY
jgi:hypothetical protein